jgi:SAM-dependent methyltransferase
MFMEHKEYRRLHAEWYELVSSKKDHSEEINFWVRSIEASSEPILELGSGTGRILIPLLERDFDITGIDSSQDMMDRCREICNKKGLKVDLYEKSMLDFDLPRKFGLVILGSGGLGLFTHDKDIHSMFERVMVHLKPGGLFIYEFEPVPIEDNKKQNDNNWVGDWVSGSNDVVIAWRSKNKYNATTHVWERLFVVEKFVSGRLVETEENERMGRFFTVDEAIQYAKSAGFENIKATNWLTEDPPSNDSKVITIQCRKLR